MAAKRHSDKRTEVIVIGAILTLYARLQTELVGVDQEFALSRSQRSVIMSLAENRRLGWLSKELGLAPSAITAIADDLTALGLVRRIQDPDDRRAVSLGLTKTGGERLAALLAASSRILRTVTGLSSADIERLAEIFDRMAVDPKGLSS